MVTIAQAKIQLQTQRTALESQRQQIQQRTQQPRLSPAQLRAQTRQALAQRDLERKSLASIRQQALQTLKPVEQELTKFESEIKSVEKEIQVAEKERSDFAQAKKLFTTGVTDPAASPGVKRFLREFQAGRELQVESKIKEEIQTLEERGLTPIFVDGELRGFEDALAKQSRTLADIKPVVIEGKLVGVEDIRFQLSRQLKVPIEVGVTPPELPPGIVRAGETNIEQLARNIKESIPQLKFIKDEDLRRILQRTVFTTGLPTIIGTERFLRSELKQALADPTGAFKFRPDQADPIADLIFEVAEGFGAGALIGKGVTLIRGAGARFLPKTLTGSSRFNRITTILGTAGIITLTGAAGLSIAKTFKDEGEDAAILQTIGLISFGVGFTATGLRSLPQAKKEFDQVANLLKRVVPVGKRGEARFDQLGVFFRKKERDRFGELKQLDRKDIERSQEVLNKLEKRIAEAKTSKEQLKILAEIKKKLTTPQAKKNFEIFVLGLINKQVIKLPRVEIKPGELVAVVPRVKSRSRLNELRRIQTNLARNQRRITQSKKPLGQRYKEAQGITVTLALTTTQRIAARQQERQKAIEKQRIQQKNIQKTRQRLILRTRTISKTALRQLLRQSFKISLKPKIAVRLKPLVFGVPIIPFPRKRKIKKIVKILPFDIKGKSFDVLTRRKGKFIVFAKNLPPNRAKRRLAIRLDNRISASGRIVPSSKPPKKKDIARFNIPQKIFRFPKKNSPLIKPNTFTIVEKRKFRINTPQEKESLREARFKARKIKLKSTP